MAMARASSRLRAVFLLLFCFSSISSIHVRFALSLSSNDLPFSCPTVILIFSGAASIGDSPPKAEPSEAESDRSKAPSSSSGRLSSYAKEVLPLWGNLTGGMASLASNFSSQITPYSSSSSCFAWTAPHVCGQSLVLLPFPVVTTTNWNGDHRRSVAVEFSTCFNPETDARGSKLVGNDVNSTEYTEKTSPSKNLSSLLLLPRLSYLASHAAAGSVDYGGSLVINMTELCSHVYSVLQEQQPAGYFSAGSVGNNVEYHNLIESVLLENLILIVGCVELNAPITQGNGRVPRRERYRLPYEPKTRRLLPGRTTYGRRESRKQHPAIRGKVASSWLLEQAFVAGSALVGLICAVAGLLLCCIRSKRPRQSPASTELEDDEHMITEPELWRGLGPREFRYSELAAATNNFAEERKIGRGGFGPVYRGCLIGQDRQVAIKALSRDEQSVQGLKEFQAEVTILSQLRHRNIVKLVGWCGRRRELALVYELVPGGSLDTHLYNPDRHLTWPQRYKIALQLGSALRYLHTDCDQCVVHGDIKPANVMLDASLNAKLGDFGLARLVDHGAEPQTTQVVAGTVGYIDPEFVSSRRPSAECDVYSFGVVLLEIACGRRPTPSRRSGQAASAALLASVRDMYRRNVIVDAADRRLVGEFDRSQMERLLVTGLWCAHHDPVQRPSVAQAMDVLRSEDAELPVLATMGGSVEIRNWEGRAYGDLSAESSAYLQESTETAYLTTEETAYLFAEE